MTNPSLKEKALACALTDIVGFSQRLREQMSVGVDTDPRFQAILEVRNRLDQLYWEGLNPASIDTNPGTDTPNALK